MKSISFLKQEVNLPSMWGKVECIYNQHVDHFLGKTIPKTFSPNCGSNNMFKI